LRELTLFSFSAPLPPFQIERLHWESSRLPRGDACVLL
jgi:hypothetical protein